METSTHAAKKGSHALTADEGKPIDEPTTMQAATANINADEERCIDECRSRMLGGTESVDGADADCGSEGVAVKETAEVSANGSVHDIDPFFGGLVSSCIHCLRCGYESVKLEAFLELPLPMQQLTALQREEQEQLIQEAADRAKLLPLALTQPSTAPPLEAISVASSVPMDIDHSDGTQSDVIAESVNDSCVAAPLVNMSEQSVDDGSDVIMTSTADQSSALSAVGSGVGSAAPLVVSAAISSLLTAFAHVQFLTIALAAHQTAIQSQLDSNAADISPPPPSPPLPQEYSSAVPSNIPPPPYPHSESTALVVYTGPQNIVESIIQKKTNGDAATTLPASQPTHVQATTSTADTLQLSAMIDLYLSPELLDASNAYHCSSCNSKQPATKTLNIVQPPKHLLVCIKRNEYDWRTQKRNKLMTEVVFPCLLKLPLKPQQHTTHSPREDSPAFALFVLYSVVVHSGSSAQSGHYYTIARRSEQARRHIYHHLSSKYHSTMSDAADARSIDEIAFDDSDENVAANGDWICFNDATVSQSSWKTICTLSQTFSLDHAYLLWYRPSGRR